VFDSTRHRTQGTETPQKQKPRRSGALTGSEILILLGEFLFAPYYQIYQIQLRNTPNIFERFGVEVAWNEEALPWSFPQKLDSFWENLG
jgi:hypothetical protein